MRAGAAARYGPSMGTVSRTVRIAAPPDRVWDVLSDLPSMGERSPENTGGRWAGGATGPTVGARFKGANRQGKRQWKTDVEVVRSVRGEQFAFRVSSVGLAVAEWSYDIAPDGAGGCTVTETWTDRRGGLVKRVGSLLTGVTDRDAFTATSIEQTLAAIKQQAEAGTSA